VVTHTTLGFLFGRQYFFPVHGFNPKAQGPMSETEISRPKGTWDEASGKILPCALLCLKAP
jgi:hypothetical protein